MVRLNEVMIGQPEDWHSINSDSLKFTSFLSDLYLRSHSCLPHCAYNPVLARDCFPCNVLYGTYQRSWDENTKCHLKGVLFNKSIFFSSVYIHCYTHGIFSCFRKFWEITDVLSEKFWAKWTDSTYGRVSKSCSLPKNMMLY